MSKQQKHAGVWVPKQGVEVPERDMRLRLLSFNIQLGLETRRYSHYLTRGWRHAVPSRGQHANLDRIADMIRGYDFVALQEADAGSLRTRFMNQMEYLARRADFAHWGYTITRDLWPVARHCLGYLSRIRPIRDEPHRLPSRIPGRGAVMVELGPDAADLRVIVTHLSLSAGARRLQLEYIDQIASKPGPTVLMGDLNCEASDLRKRGPLRESGLWLPDTTPATFPSWRPSRSIDHILLSPDVTLHELKTLPAAGSDHLPLAVEIGLDKSRA